MEKVRRRAMAASAAFGRLLRLESAGRFRDEYLNQCADALVSSTDSAAPFLLLKEVLTTYPTPIPVQGAWGGSAGGRKGGETTRNVAINRLNKSHNITSAIVERILSAARGTVEGKVRLNGARGGSQPATTMNLSEATDALDVLKFLLRNTDDIFLSINEVKGLWSVADRSGATVGGQSMRQREEAKRKKGQAVETGLRTKDPGEELLHLGKAVLSLFKAALPMPTGEGSQPLMERNTAKEFLCRPLSSVPSETMSPDAFVVFRRCFLRVNAACGKLKALRTNIKFITLALSAQDRPFALEALWNIAQNAVDPGTYKPAVTLLVALYQNLPADEAIPEIRDTASTPNSTAKTPKSPKKQKQKQEQTTPPKSSAVKGNEMLQAKRSSGTVGQEQPRQPRLPLSVMARKDYVYRCVCTISAALLEPRDQKRAGNTKVDSNSTDQKKRARSSSTLERISRAKRCLYLLRRAIAASIRLPPMPSSVAKWLKDEAAKRAKTDKNNKSSDKGVHKLRVSVYLPPLKPVQKSLSVPAGATIGELRQSVASLLRCSPKRLRMETQGGQRLLQIPGTESLPVARLMARAGAPIAIRAFREVGRNGNSVGLVLPAESWPGLIATHIFTYFKCLDVGVGKSIGDGVGENLDAEELAGKTAQSAWKLLESLPPSPVLLKALKNLEKPLAVLLPPKQPLQLLYVFNAIMFLAGVKKEKEVKLDETGEEMKEEKAARLWIELFWVRHGFDHVLKLLVSEVLQLPEAERSPAFKSSWFQAKRVRCLGAMLRLLAAKDSERILEAARRSIGAPRLTQALLAALAIAAGVSQQKGDPRSAPAASSLKDGHFAEASDVIPVALRLILQLLDDKCSGQKSSIAKQDVLGRPELPLLAQQVLLCPQQATREILRDQMRRITAAASGHAPAVASVFERALLSLLPDVGRYTGQSKEYFDVLMGMLERPSSSSSTSAQRLSVLRQIVEQVRAHSSTESARLPAREPDHALQGLLRVLSVLVRQLTTPEMGKAEILRKAIAVVRPLVRELYRIYLYPEEKKEENGEDGMNLEPKACHPSTRKACLAVLVAVASADVESLRIVLDLMSHSGEIVSGRLLGDGSGSDSMAENTEGRAGLVNLGCTCYINALMQQIAGIPSLAIRLLLAAPLQQENAMNVERTQKSSEEDQVDETMPSPLEAVQTILLNILYADHKAYNPSKEVKALMRHFGKTSGQHVDERSQMDVNEFGSFLIQWLEKELKGTNDPKLLNDYFGGSLAQKLTRIDDASQFRYQFNDFWSLTISISGKDNLMDCLRLFTRSETLQGVRWGVPPNETTAAAKKRMSLKKVPEVLILNLARFAFDMNTLSRRKVNDRVEFPFELDMAPFTVAAKEIDHQAQGEGKEAKFRAGMKDKKTIEPKLINKKEEEATEEEQEEEDDDNDDDDDDDVLGISKAEPGENNNNNGFPGAAGRSGPVAVQRAQNNDEEFRELEVSLRGERKAECESSETNVFDLHGVVLHQGTASRGHYYSLLKTASLGSKLSSSWIECNDTVVRPFSSLRLDEEAFGGVDSLELDGGKQKVVIDRERNAYLLVYLRKRKRLGKRLNLRPSLRMLAPRMSLPVRKKAVELLAENTRLAHCRRYLAPEHFDFALQILQKAFKQGEKCDKFKGYALASPDTRDRAYSSLKGMLVRALLQSGLKVGIQSKRWRVQKIRGHGEGKGFVPKKKEAGNSVSMMEHWFEMLRELLASSSNVAAPLLLEWFTEDRRNDHTTPLVLLLTCGLNNAKKKVVSLLDTAVRYVFRFEVNPNFPLTPGTENLISEPTGTNPGRKQASTLQNELDSIINRQSQSSLSVTSPVSSLRGIGTKTKANYASVQIHTLSDLARISKSQRTRIKNLGLSDSAVSRHVNNALRAISIIVDIDKEKREEKKKTNVVAGTVSQPEGDGNTINSFVGQVSSGIAKRFLGTCVQVLANIARGEPRGLTVADTGALTDLLASLCTAPGDQAQNVWNILASVGGIGALIECLLTVAPTMAVDNTSRSAGSSFLKLLSLLTKDIRRKGSESKGSSDVEILYKDSKMLKSLVAGCGGDKETLSSILANISFGKTKVWNTMISVACACIFEGYQWIGASFTLLRTLASLQGDGFELERIRLIVTKLLHLGNTNSIYWAETVKCISFLASLLETNILAKEVLEASLSSAVWIPAWVASNRKRPPISKKPDEAANEVILCKPTVSGDYPKSVEISQKQLTACRKFAQHVKERMDFKQ